MFATAGIEAGNLAPKQTKIHFLTEIPFFCPSIVLFYSLSSCFQAGVGWTNTRALWLTCLLSSSDRATGALAHATKITEMTPNSKAISLISKAQLSHYLAGRNSAAPDRRPMILHHRTRQGPCEVTKPPSAHVGVGICSVTSETRHIPSSPTTTDLA